MSDFLALYEEALRSAAKAALGPKIFTLDTAEGIELDAFAWLYYGCLRADGETDEQLRAACRAKEVR